MSDTVGLILLGNEVEDLSTTESRERVLDLWMRAEVATKLARELKARCAEKLAEWIDANGEITVGDVRYYVGRTKVHKPHDLRFAAERILEIVHGDLDAFVETLASDAFKPGHCRKLLAERFDEVFSTEDKLDLKTGKPKRELKVVNERYLPKGEAA